MNMNVQTTGTDREKRASQRQYSIRLRQTLDERFDDGELRTFCFDLDVDYDGLSGDSKTDKIVALITYLERRGRIPDLVQLGRKQRTEIDWGDEFEAAAPIGVEATEFVNREDELGLLNVERLRTSRSPYTLVSAPAGYGKSYLLQRLINAIDSDETLQQKWCVRYIEFDPGKRATRIASVVRAITGASPDERAADTNTNLASYIVGELSAPLSGERRAVLLIFDAVEHLDEQTQQWLYILLNDLHRRTHVGHQEIITVRVIVAGRNTEQFWEKYEQTFTKPAPRRINLRPFDEHPIRELIWDQVQAADIPLDDQTIGQISDEVQYLSGGHPTVICDLIDDLARQSFAIGPPDEYFVQNRKRLVRTYLSPVAGDLLENIEDRFGATIREIVQTLSIFRQISASTILALVETSILSDEIDEVELLGKMQRAQLLAGPTIQRPFYHDHLMRRVLMLDVAHVSPQTQAQYRRLNEIALDLYASWIHNPGGQGLPDSPLKATQRLWSVVEWLFHALQDEGIDEEKLRSGLQEHIDVLSEDNQSPLIADLIADAIRSDSEICYLLRQRLHGDGVDVICNWMKPA